MSTISPTAWRGGRMHALRGLLHSRLTEGEKKRCCCSVLCSTIHPAHSGWRADCFLPFFFFFPPPWFSQRPSLHSHNSKTCYNPILVGEYLALLSQQYGIWVILLNMNGPFTRLNGVAWQWPFFPSLLLTQNNIQRSSLGTFPRNQQKRNSKLSLKPSKH